MVYVGHIGNAKALRSRTRKSIERECATRRGSGKKARATSKAKKKDARRNIRANR